VLRGENPPAKARQFYWALPNPTGKEFAWRDGDWKLHLDSAQKPLELYDLSRDPLELTNRLATEPARVEAMAAAFRAQHAAVLADPLRPATEQKNH
jgi:arylsulfatase A-like enzyme